MSAMSPECLSERQWRERLAHRFDPERTEPESWPQDLDHLDRCDSCRERAVELDPSLLFRRLAAPALDEAAETASMQRAVAALRRAERVVKPEPRTAVRAWTIGGRWAAAALVALSALSLGAGVWSGGGSSPAPQVESLAAVAPALSPAPEPAREEVTSQEVVDSLPLYEPVGASMARRVEEIWVTDEGAVILMGDSEGPQDV